MKPNRAPEGYKLGFVMKSGQKFYVANSGHKWMLFWDGKWEVTSKPRRPWTQVK